MFLLKFNHVFLLHDYSGYRTIPKLTHHSNSLTPKRYRTAPGYTYFPPEIELYAQ